MASNFNFSLKLFFNTVGDELPFVKGFPISKSSIDHLSGLNYPSECYFALKYSRSDSSMPPASISCFDVEI